MGPDMVMFDESITLTSIIEPKVALLIVKPLLIVTVLDVPLV